jgi:hypothetical protein
VLRCETGGGGATVGAGCDKGGFNRPYPCDRVLVSAVPFGIVPHGPLPYCFGPAFWSLFRSFVATLAGPVAVFLSLSVDDEADAEVAVASSRSRLSPRSRGLFVGHLGGLW